MDGIREQRIAETFVELADTLVDDFDVLDFLHALARRCADLLAVDAVGIMLADAHGFLQVAASSVEEARLVELFEVQNDEGPCLDCFRTGEPIINPGTAAATRWPRFTARSRASGYVSTHALPLRLRGKIIGTLNLFLRRSGDLDTETVHLGQALADVATIALLQQRSLHDAQVLTGQLQTALTSRIALEQAKGIVAERFDMSLEDAFEALRSYARANRQRLSELTDAVINRPDTVFRDAGQTTAPFDGDVTPR